MLRDIIISIPEYRKEFKHKIIHIIFTVIIFMSFGGFYSYLKKETYTAVLTFVVEDESEMPTFSPASGGITDLLLGGGSNSSTFSQQNVIEILKTRTVIESTLYDTCKINKKKDLFINHYIRINDLRNEWIEDSRLRNLKFGKEKTFLHDSICGIIFRQIITTKLEVEKQNNDASFINLSYTSLDDRFAKYFVENLMDKMSELYIARQTEKPIMILNNFKDRNKTLTNELDIAYDRYYDLLQRDLHKNKRYGYDRQPEVDKALLEIKRLNELKANIEIQIEAAEGELLNKTPIFAVFDRPVIPLSGNKKSLETWILLGFLLGLFFSCFIVFINKLYKDVSQDVDSKDELKSLPV